MSQLPHLFAAALMLAAVLASLCIWSRRRLAFRITGLVVTAMYIPFAYVSLVDLLSRPKPLVLERSHERIAEATVISSVLREGEAIFVWLQIPEVGEPRSYALPWTRPQIGSPASRLWSENAVSATRSSCISSPRMSS